MTTAETIASTLPFLCLVAALFRAPLVALPLLPPCALIVVRALALVDLSSATHPARWLVPVASMTLALGVTRCCVGALRELAIDRQFAQDHSLSPRWSVAIALAMRRQTRALVASLLVFASSGPDVLALFAWRLPGEFILVPFQIGVCLAVIGVLMAPERWFRR